VDLRGAGVVVGISVVVVVLRITEVNAMLCKFRSSRPTPVNFFSFISKYYGVYTHAYEV